MRREALSIPHGTIRATVLIETLPAAFEMDEILYELQDHVSGLNAGRWDYLFSLIKKLRAHADVLPDRGQVTMTVPFMRAYAELLVKTCHRRGAHAMGGMAPFIPTRKDAEVNERALAKVRADKDREVADGFDGTWVAHPDLVPTAWEVFEKALGTRPNQKERLREDVVRRRRGSSRTSPCPNGTITEAGVRLNVNVTLQYLELVAPGKRRRGDLQPHGRRRDGRDLARAALAVDPPEGEARRTVGRSRRTSTGTVRDEELPKVGGLGSGRMQEAVEILDRLVLDDALRGVPHAPRVRVPRVRMAGRGSSRAERRPRARPSGGIKEESEVVSSGTCRDSGRSC